MTSHARISGRTPGARIAAAAPKARLQVAQCGKELMALQPVGSLSQSIPQAALVAAAALALGPITVIGGGDRVRVTYSTAMVTGQIVYLDAGVAYPVSRNMPEAVTKLLAQIIHTAPAGTTDNVLIEGLAENSSYDLPAGIVFLGDDGFPTGNAYGESGNYVPLGFSRGGTSFNFAPEGRYFRSV